MTIYSQERKNYENIESRTETETGRGVSMHCNCNFRHSYPGTKSVKDCTSKWRLNCIYNCIWISYRTGNHNIRNRRFLWNPTNSSKKFQKNSLVRVFLYYSKILWTSYNINTLHRNLLCKFHARTKTLTLKCSNKCQCY